MLTRGLAATATAVLLTFTAAGAHAATTASDIGDLPNGVVLTPELEDHLSGLSQADRQVFINTQLPASIELTVGEQVPANATARASLAASKAARGVVSPMATGCWTQRFTRQGTALAGNTLYTYYHVNRWCSSGSTVTSASVADFGGETSTPGWRYNGVIRSGAGVVSNQGRSYSQHSFTLGAGGIDVQNPVPCIRGKGTSAGTGSHDTTCGIY